MRQKPETVSTLTKVLYTIEETCFIIGSGKTALYAAIGAGRLRAVKDGDRTKLTREAIDDYVGQLPPFKPRGTPGSEAQ